MLRYIVSFSGPPIFEIPRVYAGVNGTVCAAAKNRVRARHRVRLRAVRVGPVTTRSVQIKMCET